MTSEENKSVNISIEQSLWDLIKYIPDEHKTNRQYVNFLEFLENREWELALDSLVELADETNGNDLSITFWIEISDIAHRIGLNDKVEYCQRHVSQIEALNKSKISYKDSKIITKKLVIK